MIVMLVRLPPMARRTVRITQTSLPVLVIKPTVLFVKSRVRSLLMLRVLPVMLVPTVPQMVQPTVSLILYVVTKPTILSVQQQLMELKLPIQFVPIVPPVQKV